ncbi:MAG TPA: indolepyruvate ferredoxin oxidoreductase family protein [bacterium]|nr:indolepyruvate ferredoxin oxidoreductase family protein [bacterium]
MSRCDRWWSTPILSQVATARQHLEGESIMAGKFTLDDKYTALEGRVLLTGIQALVRLPMDQHRRDLAAGLRTGTYISGYQGSPLGELDKQMRLAGKHLKDHEIVFQAGINEDVAATAIYGSQFLESFPHSRYDGIVGIWYGKAPGVDRTGDAFRHAQFIGTSTHGACLALGGDDPACKSSTIPSDVTVAFYDFAMPTLYPANPQEVLEMGLHGIAMSRYSGLWSAMKIVTNVADGGAIIDVHPEMARPVLPQLEIGGRLYRKTQDVRLIPPFSVDIERQIHYERMVAARAYAAANGLDRTIVRSSGDRIGLVAAGKSYTDLMHALQMLGFNTYDLQQAGIRVYKLGLIAPIEPEGIKRFAEGLQEVLVVEEKRGFCETQIRDALYNLPQRPKVYGKYDEHGQPLFPIHNEMQVDQVSRLLAAWLAPRLNRPDLLTRTRWLEDIAERKYDPVMGRTPYFCSGCPHNTSTKVLEGEQAGGGIGCHAMASSMNRGIVWLTHMGGEGAPWMGVAPFTEKEHIFQNVGDGTYYHSASKALEACVASGVNITFKLLYNAAVAMTGGQQVLGLRTPLELARKLEAEGVAEIVIVPEDPSRYTDRRVSPKIRVEDKDHYDQVQAQLKQVPGTTVIIFDQQCAAQKRRLRKRGLLATPPQRVVINQSICEGCGDCGTKSNCLSVVPVETDYGRKTMIHQSSCNLDYSCIKGDCPSFMTVQLGAGAKPVKRKGMATHIEEALPEPARKVASDKPYKAMLIGIGGTGVVTVDALLCTAALLDGKYVVHLDQTGLAQKGGAVLSNLTLSDAPVEHANRIPAGEADLLIAFDLLASVSQDNLNRYHPERTVAVANTAQLSTAEVVTNVHAQFPALNLLAERLNRFTRKRENIFLNSEALAEGLFGDHMANNIFLLGVAYQAGLLPLSANSIEEAIRANAVAVEQNLMTFRWGRKYVLKPQEVLGLLRGDEPQDALAAAEAKLQRLAPALLAPFRDLQKLYPAGEALATVLHPRVADLMLYQNADYARDYLSYVAKVAQEEARRTSGKSELTETVARWLFKLMAIKDEYEVARLWLQDPAFEQARAAYEGPVKRYYHLHPPFLRRLGLQSKIRLGEWFTPVFRVLYGMRRVRGTPLDFFCANPHRRWERRLIAWYRAQIDALLPQLTPENHAVAVAVGKLPDGIRGYEAIKERTIHETEAQLATLLEQFNGNSAQRVPLVSAA